MRKAKSRLHIQKSTKAVVVYTHTQHRQQQQQQNGMAFCLPERSQAGPPRPIPTPHNNQHGPQKVQGHAGAAARANERASVVAVAGARAVRETAGPDCGLRIAALVDRAHFSNAQGGAALPGRLVARLGHAQLHADKIAS